MNKPKNFSFKKELLERPELGEVRGVKSSWQSRFNIPFQGGIERDHPCKIIRAGKKK